MLNSEIFTKELSYINDEKLRSFIAEILDTLPDYFRTIGASTSGKYHPAYALGEGGLIRHTQAAVGIAKELFRAEIYPFDSDDEDIVMSALLLHDGLKCGMWEDKTAFTHPILMQRYIWEMLMKKDVNYRELYCSQILGIASCVASHMGKWNTQENCETVLPLPKKDTEKCVHLCDYLASRKNIEYKFEDEIQKRKRNGENK